MDKMSNDIRARFINAKRALFDRYYSSLNEQQRRAIYTVIGPLLVLAGAGSGKTTVLTKRIAHIIKFGDSYYSDRVPETVGESEISELVSALDYSREDMERVLSQYAVDPCPPWAILSITFTNKAATEMKNRLADTVGVLPSGDSSEDIKAGTFHSMCMRFLRKFTAEAGLKSGFTIYDTDDSKRIVSHIMKDLGIDEKMLSPRTVLYEISRAKDKLISPDEYAAREQGDVNKRNVAKIYQQYQLKLNESNVLDFDDIIMRTVQLLRNCREAYDYYNHIFKYVCVDEYQDTNEAQLELILLLSALHKNLMVVGDDDQSIYKFRGARIENILTFDRALPDVKVIKLEQNYRSTQNILSAANAVIANNLGRHGKELYTDRGDGEKITIKKLDSQNEEARYIINRIAEQSIKEKRKFNDFAILYRINAQSNSLEQVFAKSGIPYRVLGGLRFYERKEIKDIIAYLCVINNHGDNLRLRRIINEPKRKIGETTVNALETLASYENLSMFEVMERSDEFTAIAKFAPKLKEFASLINSLADIAKSESLPVLIEKTIELTGYRRMLLEAGEQELDRLENVQELVSNAVEFVERTDDPSLEGFLEEISLISDIDNYDESNDAVSLMTIHSAKGLEFPVVFLPGFEDGIFPGMQAILNPDELEEERRLVYVAITRAKDRLYLTHARERLLYGRTQFNHPSRFLREIPDDYIDSDYLKRRREAAEARAENKDSSGDSQSERTRKTVISKEFFKKADSVSDIGKKYSLSSFKEGDVVIHANFGRGEIIAARPMGADILYEICFDTVGTKKLMATYAKLKRIDE